MRNNYIILIFIFIVLFNNCNEGIENNSVSNGDPIKKTDSIFPINDSDNNDIRIDIDNKESEKHTIVKDITINELPIFADKSDIIEELGEPDTIITFFESEIMAFPRNKYYYGLSNLVIEKNILVGFTIKDDKLTLTNPEIEIGMDCKSVLPYYKSSCNTSYNSFEILTDIEDFYIEIFFLNDTVSEISSYTPM